MAGRACQNAGPASESKPHFNMGVYGKTLSGPVLGPLEASYVG